MQRPRAWIDELVDSNVLATYAGAGYEEPARLLAAWRDAHRSAHGR